MTRKLALCWYVPLLLILLQSGCGRDNSPKTILAAVNKSNIQRLANLYTKYQSEHKWVGPGSEEEFRKYVAGLAPERLEILGIQPDKVDELFRSERDNETFVFRYKVVGSAMGKVEPVVFEKTGVEGKKMVGFTNNPPVEAADENEYKNWLSGKYVHQTRDRGSGAPPGIPGS